MNNPDARMSELIAAMHATIGEQINELLLPPPVFKTLGGKILAFDITRGVLSARFPVEEKYLNPFHTLQGGIIAAIIDNTLGPLSAAIAPPNVTRNLSVTYSHPVTAAMGQIIIQAEFLERQERRLFFKAEVRSLAGQRLARAKAEHWII